MTPSPPKLTYKDPHLTSPSTFPLARKQGINHHSLNLSSPPAKSTNEKVTIRSMKKAARRKSSGSSELIIWVLWNPNVIDLNVIDTNRQAIHCSISITGQNIAFFTSFIYAANSVIERHVLWENIILHAGNFVQSPWRLMEDFNAIPNAREKYGGSMRWCPAMTDFKECLQKVELEDLKFNGILYSWCNRSSGVACIAKKLDRALVNQKWTSSFLVSECSFLTPGISDHSPILVSTDFHLPRRCLPLKFFNAWNSHPKFLPSVQEVWNTYIKGTTMYQCVQKLKLLKQGLKINCKKEFTDIESKLHLVKMEFDSCQLDLDSNPSNDLFRHLEKSLSNEYLRNGKLLSEANNTYIALVPKCQNLTSIHDYRPISYCNSIYKCIAKILAYKLQQTLPPIIDMSQSAFISGRKITDPILLAHELLRGWKIFNETVAGIEILFKEKDITTLNLPLQNACISSPFFTIAINGEFQGYLKGKRGLRQGDPISPFLFVIVMDALSSIINDYVRRSHTFKFHWRCGPLKITHLLYADDLMLFCHGDITSVSVLKSALDHFCCMSGLDINFSKSSIYFSGTDPHIEAAITSLLGIGIGSFPVKYLEVPLISTNLKSSHCSQFIEKITNRISNWSSRSISYAGRPQLIKAVLVSTQVYWSSIFILPKAVINELNQIFRAFLWSGPEMKISKAKVNCNKVCLLKEQGGLGIPNLELSNKVGILRSITLLQISFANYASHQWSTTHGKNGMIESSKGNLLPKEWFSQESLPPSLLFSNWDSFVIAPFRDKFSSTGIFLPIAVVLHLNYRTEDCLRLSASSSRVQTRLSSNNFH
ncbi:uncharacterized protein LOC132304657 [Cornus florida]|uniref:uncharacterized protein LOC132304657 n=1 Tax=Cornus florida TaxID=4283 RepID=UPI00289FE198|nr:uncharacterized protein LOC132304657 [Cornus florida]